MCMIIYTCGWQAEVFVLVIRFIFSKELGVRNVKFTTECTEIDKYEVAVLGAGPAGAAAAIAAARCGAKTILIESSGRVGGMSTAGMMSHFTGTVGNRLYWEIIKRAGEKNRFASPHITVIDPEMLEITYLEMLEESGVDIMLNTTVYDTVMDGNRLKGVICANKSGFFVYNVSVAIDATGDGDAAYKCGAEFVKGREKDGKMQPATLMFKVAGVDMERAVFPPSFETLVETEKGELQALAKEKLPHPAGHVLLYRSTIPGVVTCNMTNVTDIDGTSAEDLTRAEMGARKQIIPIIDFLREYVPGYENCYLIGSASLIGIRETRHFKGVKTLTKNDIENAVQYDDYVVYDALFNFDVHNLTGSGLDETGCQKNFKQTNGYTIPFGCLIPEKIDGLILAGRNISGTHMAHSSYRAMPICVGTGEAAGIAAAVAVEKGVDIRDIDVREIQNRL